MYKIRMPKWGAQKNFIYDKIVKCGSIKVHNEKANGTVQYGQPAQKPLPACAQKGMAKNENRYPDCTGSGNAPN